MPAATLSSPEAVKAHRERMRAIFADRLGAPMVRAMMSTGRRDFTGTTWEEALAWLHGGITVTVPCAQRRGAPRRQHQIRFAADGTIDLLAHPGENLAGQRMLLGLGGSIPGCVLVHLLLSGQIGLADWLAHERGEVAERLFTLFAAVAWAQHPDTDWAGLAGLLPRGITPDRLASWLAAGWTLEQAKPFLLAGAEQSVAEAWRAAGKTNTRIARLAARGSRPHDDTAWLDAGFTVGAAQRWRTARGGPVEPRLAKRLDDAGWTPDRWQDFLRVRVRRVGQGLLVPDEETAIAWTEAGVPADMVERWFAATGGDLDEARLWSTLDLLPEVYETLKNPVFRRWVGGGPNLTSVAIPAPVDWVMPSFEQVAEWLRVGGSDSRGLVAALSSGLSPAEFAAVDRVMYPPEAFRPVLTHRLHRVLLRLGKPADSPYLY